MQFNEITQISSRQNNKAKIWLKLKTTQGVKKHDLILIEGVRFCITALQNQAEIKTFLFVDNKIGEKIFTEFQRLISSSMPEKLLDFEENSFRIGEELFQNIANVRNPQGVIFITKKPDLWALDDWITHKQPQKIVLLDKIADPGNLGTIIRTAHAFNYTGLILKAGSVDPYNPKVLRSTMGSLFALDLIEVKSYQEIKQLDLKLLVSDMNGILLPKYDRSQIKQGHILAIGNEAHGIDEDLIKLADDIISIPMARNIESLNAAIAFAIMAYQLEQP
ncbi:MAG: RNA methyltransferase [Clostridiaceae bacterium]|nr:RNA methyltransferase [Clostridiaceae bacterium]